MYGPRYQLHSTYSLGDNIGTTQGNRAVGERKLLHTIIPLIHSTLDFEIVCNPIVLFIVSLTLKLA